MRTALIFGARPNFMKIAPVYRAMRERGGFDPILVHTGQHFDREMSDDFVEALQLPAPDVNLEVGAGSQGWHIAEVMKRLEPLLLDRQPNLTVVVGDVSSTLGAALISHTVGIPVAHVEAGLRSRDWSMPEERNRVLTDHLSRFLLTPSEDADANLLAEGIDPPTIHFVGNVMIDSLDDALPRLPREEVRARLEVADGPYGLVTLHRPSNVDEPAVLKGLMGALKRISLELPLVFPVHPRTRSRLENLDVRPGGNVRLLEPLGYLEFLSLLVGAGIVLTDSGGIQEEAAVLGVPCLTLRDNTERPITLAAGTNELVGSDPKRVVEAAFRQLNGPPPVPNRPPLWDGKASQRIVEVLEAAFG
jgi:UDP-N-acetylglucosamine 2-epimerase (non-hydrolysing)